jgi:hypothetical protein
MAINQHIQYLQYAQQTQINNDYVNQARTIPSLKTPNSGLSQHLIQDETPKYIRNLRGELNIALKSNLELHLRLEQLEKVN